MSVLAGTWAVFAAAAGIVEGSDVDAAALRRALDRCHTAWPDLLGDDELAGCLGSRVAGAASPAEALDALHVEDLALALACTRRHEPALRAFERDYAATMTEVAVPYGLDRAGADEIVQGVREKLFGTRGDARIAEYAGRGPLRKWLRVIVRRAGLDFARARGREVEVRGDAELVEDLRGGNLDLDYLKREYGDLFQEAFAAALRSLDTRERNVLRHHLVNGLKIEEIAGIYRVSRRTVTRWIAGARASMLQTVRETVQATARIPDSQINSFLRDIRSNLDVSLSVALKRPAPARTR